MCKYSIVCLLKTLISLIIIIISVLNKTSTTHQLYLSASKEIKLFGTETMSCKKMLLEVFKTEHRKYFVQIFLILNCFCSSATEHCE